MQKGIMYRMQTRNEVPPNARPRTLISISFVHLKHADREARIASADLLSRRS